MIVGVLEIELSLPDCKNIKDKRRIVKSVRDRVRNKFNVAIAEVELQDNIRGARFGIVSISGTRIPCERVLRSVQRFIEGTMMIDVRFSDIVFW